MSAVNLEAVEPGQWAIIRDSRARFYEPAWTGQYYYDVGRQDEIDGFAAGPVKNPTPTLIIMAHDVCHKARHDRKTVVAVVADREAARAALARIRERQDQRAVECRPHEDAIAAARTTASVDIDNILNEVTL